MTTMPTSRRARLVRESLLFQVKLMVDGVRDFILMPVAVVATVVGLLRSAEDPDEEFQRVMELGRKSEQWINLFGDHEPISEAGEIGSLDGLVTRAEEVLREEVRQGGVSERAGQALGRALARLHEKSSGSGKPPG